MGLFSAIDRFIKRHSFFFNVSTNVLLAIVSLICYALVVILFLKASWLQLRSLVYIEDSNISPTVVIGLISILLSGSTATLLTRAVEHSLWLKLVPREMKNRITVAESRRLAQWSVSALSRVLYLFSGNSWLLRFGGILLLATAAVSPVLLSGVTPTLDTVGSTSDQARTMSMFMGYLDRGNSRYNGGNYYDNPMEVAALASMGNMNAPASSVCSSPSCQVDAVLASLHAECQPLKMDNPNRIGLQGPGNSTQTFCSLINPTLCVDLSYSNPATFANFTTGPQGISARCDDIKTGSSTSADCPGEWATVFGVWVNGVDYTLEGTYPIYAVDCVVRYGNVTVTQNGGGTPAVDRDSFVKSSYALETGSEIAWHRVYVETPIVAGPQFALQDPTAQNLYTFTAIAGGAGSNTLYQNAVGSLLLNYADANGSDAEVVARRIERNFDMATLFAFSKEPDATERTIRITASTPIWKYEPEVLAVLAIPLLATLLVIIGRWRVGDHEEVVGYDPVEIARRHPVLREGLMGQAEEVRPYVRPGYGDEDDAEEKLEVWAVKTHGRGDGGTSVRTRLVTG